jgi:integrase
MKLPKFVHAYVDRYGHPRYYLRRRGYQKVPLPGLPWSPMFMAAYEEARAGQSPVQLGRGNVKPGTLRALAISYFTSPTFRGMAPNTQANYRRAIESFCKRTDKQGREYGTKIAAELRREHVVRFMASRADRPEAANFLRKLLRALMQHAIEIGIRTDDPTKDTKAIRVRSDGFHSWTEAEIEQFERTHPIGSRARRAFALLLYTGQRRGDVVRMGPQHIQAGMLRVRQEKTGFELMIPIHPRLLEIIAETPSDHLNYIVTRNGGPFRSGSFGNWFREACITAGLPHCSAHGLRKAAARRLAEAGATAHEVASITGHRSLSQVTRYTRAVDQQKLAIRAMAKIT